MSYFRSNIEQMGGYVPGFQPKGSGYIKLNTNENPYPPSPRALEALRQACGERLRKYPPPAADGARATIAEVFGTVPERVLCANGSDELLTLALRSFCGEGDAVAFPVPTYSLYEVLARIQGARAVQVDFPEDFSLPEGLADTGVRLALVCNPNAPSGTVVPPADLERLARSLDGVLLIDEAYVDFAEQDCLNLVGLCPNVVVTRSLSKSYSLAGLRFGFAVAQEPLIEGMMKVKDSYNVSAPAAAGAAAAILDQQWMRANAAKIKATRRRLADGLDALGFRCLPSQTNFVLARVPDGRSAATMQELLLERKILVRYFNAPRLDDSLRITVGTDQETETLLAALSEVLGGRRATVETGKGESDE